MKVQSVLEKLLQEDFQLRYAMPSTAASIRSSLVSAPEVRAIADAVRTGSLSEQRIRRFVDSLLTEFKPGKRFPHQLSLAAVAVALEDLYLPIAEEFLIDLGRIRRAELASAVAVARECLKNRHKPPKQKTFILSTISEIETRFTNLSTSAKMTARTSYWDRKYAQA